jgi:hypothetical protein
MKSRSITAKEADEVLEKWASQSLQVCFAVCFGRLAWHVHWLGPIRTGQSGRWTQTTAQTTNVVSSDLYDEIVLMEDEDLIGIRFRNSRGLTAADFEVDLFVAKRGDVVRQAETMLKKMFE